MVDIKTVQLIVNSEQEKSSIRTAFERYSNRLHLKRYGIFSVQRETIRMENLAIKNHKTLHNAIWKNSGPMQPCMEPFGKNMDLCKRAGRQIFQKWDFTSNEGAISLLRGITRTDFYATACNVRRAFPWFPPH